MGVCGSRRARSSLHRGANKMKRNLRNYKYGYNLKKNMGKYANKYGAKANKYAKK